ncbi:efflux transporter outer membrane subunit [Dyella telluris]|uniref:efflux transporter outer membrane subunit n=1 Tax=Dyella telluris TaxID=2763498 RepID=UPI001C9A515A|nr:efflux transporter outer membrane subunit [Dyella telluris]
MCAIGGCTLGPDYVRPSAVTPNAFRFAGDVPATPASESTLTPLPAWWKSFGDADLDALVDEGLAANHDLRIATARVEAFSAQVVVTGAQGLPQVGYGASAARQKVSSSTTALPPGSSGIGENYTAMVSASWELDLWGRLRRENEAARANLLATEQARLGVALTVVSSIVTGYITLLDLDRQLEISQATLEGRKSSVDVFKMRLEGGAVSEFEMMQVTAEYETAAAAIPTLQQAIAQQEHALSILVGRNPGPIVRRHTLEQLTQPPVPAGLPSDLIARRPDILQAEQQLVAANAAIGVARTLYFPSISLTAAAGTASRELNTLFTGPSRTWSFAGQLAGPLFAGGSIAALNQQARAQHDQAVEAYQLSIQNAFRDVDDALATIKAKRELVVVLERQVTALTRAVELTRERYDNGYTDYLEVLDTERSLFNSQLSLSSAQGDKYQALVSLYRALGGDWIDQVAPLPVAQQPPEHGHVSNAVNSPVAKAGSQ